MPATAKRYPVMLGVRVPLKVKRLLARLAEKNEKSAETTRRLLYQGIADAVAKNGSAELAAEWEAAR